MLVYKFKWLWLPFVEIFCTTDFELKKNLCWTFELRVGANFFLKNTWLSFIKKLLSRSRSKIKQNTKILIALRWNWNIIISMVRLFLETDLTLLEKLQKIVKIAFKNEFYKLFFQEDA